MPNISSSARNCLSSTGPDLFAGTKVNFVRLVPECCHRLILEPRYIWKLKYKMLGIRVLSGIISLPCLVSLPRLGPPSCNAECFYLHCYTENAFHHHAFAAPAFTELVANK
ncbi:hypothetical protein Droror1_Dr00009285 [Drosera rotundifolia]